MAVLAGAAAFLPSINGLLIALYFFAKNPHTDTHSIGRKMANCCNGRECIFGQRGPQFITNRTQHCCLYVFCFMSTIPTSISTFLYISIQFYTFLYTTLHIATFLSMCKGEWECEWVQHIMPRSDPSFGVTRCPATAIVSRQRDELHSQHKTSHIV